MGGGCGFLDYDRDGDQDLLLVNSCYWNGSEPEDQPPPCMALYENDGTGQFTDVTAACGLDKCFYGMGVAVGDFDNDGWSDVFFSAVGRNHLFRNAQGTFVEITASAGVAGDEQAWSTSCGWFDYNNDGLLDLLVTNYVQWAAELDLSLARTLDGVNRAYLPPTSFAGTFPYLYRNDGDGSFTDVSAASGFQVQNPATGVPIAKSLGVAFVDLDRDGWMDVVIANDTVQNFVFHNQQDGSFEEIGGWLGIAFDTNGQARAMGIDAAYFRNDASLGIVIGNFANEMTALYVSQEETLSFFGRSDRVGNRPGNPAGIDLWNPLPGLRSGWTTGRAGSQRPFRGRHQQDSGEPAIRATSAVVLERRPGGDDGVPRGAPGKRGRGLSPPDGRSRGDLRRYRPRRRSGYTADR